MIARRHNKCIKYTPAPKSIGECFTHLKIFPYIRYMHWARMSVIDVLHNNIRPNLNYWREKNLTHKYTFPFGHEHKNIITFISFMTSSANQFLFVVHIHLHLEKLNFAKIYSFFFFIIAKIERTQTAKCEWDFLVCMPFNGFR